MTEKAEDIRIAVREHYAGRAEAASPDTGASSAASCCGPAAMYPTQDMQDLDAAASMSLGCGDPVALATLRPGETVLDLGSGGGLDCFLAARAVGPEGHVIGVDMTPEMIERARVNQAAAGIENVEFRLGEIETLPVDDESVDVILSNCVINLAPDKGAVFREAYRALKPGGRLSVSDIVTEGRFGDEARADLDQWAGCVVGALEAEEYMDLMREAGFDRVEMIEPAQRPPASLQPDAKPWIYSAKITAWKPA